MTKALDVSEHSSPETRAKRLILVVIPTMENAYHSLKDFVAIQSPIGLTCIAASVERTGRSVVIIDGDAEQLQFDQAIARIVELQPDYIGATVMTATMDITRDFFRQLKKLLPATPVIVGGPHVSALPEQTLADAVGFDVCVIGEGDETIVELLAAFDARKEPDDVPGIVYRRKDQLIRTASRDPIKNLHTLPMPALHLLDKKLYRSYGWQGWVSGKRSPFGVVFTGRGCVGTCNFCAAHCVFGRGIRYFSLEQIQAQIDYLVNTWQIRILHFLDDTFTANHKMVNAICDYLIEKGYHRRLEIMVSSRVDTITETLLVKMRQASVRWICFGVESGNQEILNRMNKRTTLDQIRQAFRMARKAGFFIVGNFIIGNIGETRETVLDTIRLACELDLEYVSFAIAIPLPGTGLYQHCLDNRIHLPSWNDFGNVNTPPIPLNPDLDAQMLTELRAYAVNKFFLRIGYLFRLLTRLRSWEVLRDFATMYLALRREKKENRF